MKRNAALAFLLLAGCAGPAGGAKSRILLSADPGAVLVKEYAETVDGSMTVRCDGKEERFPLFKEERRQVEDEILEADSLRVLSLRRKVGAWDLKRRGPADAAPVAVPVSLLGKTYVVRRTEFGPALEGVDGASPDEIRANSLDQVESILSLPDHPVGPGDTWAVDGDRIVSVFGGDGSRGLKVREARGTARVEEADPAQPGVVRIGVRIEVEGAFRSLLDVDVRMDYRAVFLIDVAARRILALEASAEGKIAGEVDRQGKPAVYEGAFRYTSRGTSRPR